MENRRPDEVTRPGTTGRYMSRSVVFGVVVLLSSVVAVTITLSDRWDMWSEMAGAEDGGWRVRPLWLSGAVTCEVLVVLAGAAIWTAVFRSSGGRIDTAEAVSVWLGAQLARYLPGKVWQVTGLVSYLRAHGESGALALTVALSLQGITLATGTGVALIVLGPGVFEAVGPWAAVVAGVTIAAALTPPLLRLFMRLGRRLLREPAEIGLPTLRGSVLAGASCARLVLWLLQGIGFWLLLEGMIAENSLGPIAAMGVFAAAYITGYLVVLAPAGIVVREAAIASLVSIVGGIPLGPAATLAVAARLWSTLAELVAFGIATLGALSVRRSRNLEARRRAPEPLDAASTHGSD